MKRTVTLSEGRVRASFEKDYAGRDSLEIVEKDTGPKAETQSIHLVGDEVDNLFKVLGAIKECMET